MPAAYTRDLSHQFLRSLISRQQAFGLSVRRPFTLKRFVLRKFTLLLLSLFLLLAATGCQTQPEELPPDPALATIAFVNGQAIRQIDLDRAAEDYYAQVKTGSLMPEATAPNVSENEDHEDSTTSRDPAVITDDMKVPVLEDMIHRLLIYEHAQEEGYQVSEKEVEAAYIQMQLRYKDAEFEAVLDRYYLTEQGLKEQIHLRLLNQLFLDELDINFEPSYITDEDREEAYRIYSDEVDNPRPMEEVVWLLEDYILFRQEEQAYQLYMDEFLASLREAAEIEVFFPDVYRPDEHDLTSTTS